MTVEAQLVGLFPRKDTDSGTHLAKVNFAFKHGGMMPLKVTRSYRGDDGNYKDFEIGEIEGDCTVRVRGARLFPGKDGKPFLAADGIQVPYDVREFVATLCVEELAVRKAQKAGKAKGAA